MTKSTKKLNKNRLKLIQNVLLNHKKNYLLDKIQFLLKNNRKRNRKIYLGGNLLNKYLISKQDLMNQALTLITQLRVNQGVDHLKIVVQVIK